MEWYKRDVDAALTGMACLNMEQRGAYNAVLDMMYARDDKLPDDDEVIARTLRINPRTWRKLKAELIEYGKIWVTDEGNLTGKRVEKTLKEARINAERFANLGANRRERPEKDSKNKDGAQRVPQRESRLKSPEVREEESIPYGIDTRADVVDLFEATKPKAKKGKHRLPDDWSPSAQGMALAADELGGDRPAFETLDTFRDYWNGTGRMMADWEATWRNWVRREAKRKPNGPNGGGYANGKYRTTLGEQCEQLADELEARERAAGLR